MPRLDARLRDYDAPISERNARYFAGRLPAINGTARYLSFGGARQSKRLSRNDFRNRPASIICFRPKSAGGHAGGFDISAALVDWFAQSSAILVSDKSC